MQHLSEKTPSDRVAKTIDVIGANEHNLKNCSISIHRNALTLVTGVSGSGKSSLVFDTILAEAQRRFFYTLSHYSRQFLDIAAKPKVLQVHGLSPAIGLAQNETQPSRRASVGTLTDLAELTGLCFSNHGTRKCPIHKHPTARVSTEEIVASVHKHHGGELLAICAPLAEGKKAQFRAKLTELNEKGYLRVTVNEKVLSLNPVPELEKGSKNTLKLIVDYVRIEKKNDARLLRSIELALEESQGHIECFAILKDGSLNWAQSHRYASKGGCPECQYSWPELDARYFSANSLGRCQICNGLGILEADEDLSPDAEIGQSLMLDDVCQDCLGCGIDSTYSSITLGERTVQEVHKMSLSDLRLFWKSFETPEQEGKQGLNRVVGEMIDKIERLNKIGLSYLQMDRRIHTLSGGELQRLKLANILTESLRGVIYILDEPSQGLHPHELNALLKVFRQLQSLGNTLIIVDHDQFLIRNADWVVDMGPGGGSQGGQVTAMFKPEDCKKYSSVSKTAQKLLEQDQERASPLVRELKSEKDSKQFISFTGINRYFLKISELRFQKNALNVVCGVSGAGKSTLVHSICHRILHAMLSDPKPGAPAKPFYGDQTCKRVEGAEDLLSIHLISRKPLAKSSVSMPATYCDVFTYLRQIYEKLPEAQISGLRSRDFSLHVSGGRCEPCKGRGEITLSMKFLADARLTCSECNGKRYQATVLNIKYLGLSIADVLELTIDETLEQFKHHPKIVKKLLPARDLGLGYLRLGQTSKSLSGGEAQRLKLVPFFAKRMEAGRVLILDEPTQGLHISDINLLMQALNRFVEGQGTIIMIEHAHEVISRADWIVDLGPGSGKNGGRLVFQGPLDELADAKHSVTARYFHGG